MIVCQIIHMDLLHFMGKFTFILFFFHDFAYYPLSHMLKTHHLTSESDFFTQGGNVSKLLPVDSSICL